MMRKPLLYGAALTAVIFTLGGLYACARDSQVLAEDPEFRLTADREGKMNPFFSPDGKQVVYTSGVTGSEGSAYQSICMVPADGGAPRTLFADSSASYAVCWVPGEEAILLRSGDTELKKIDLQGNVLGSYPVESMVKVFGYVPDGNLLVRKFTGASFDIGVRALENTETSILETTECWEFQATVGPGPDDVTMVVHTEFGSSGSSLEVFNRATRENTKLPVQDAPNAGPCWSPDRKYLAYASEGEGSMNLWLMDASNQKLIPLTVGSEDDVNPNWSPDGEQVVFLRQTTTSHIRVADPNTHDVTAITEGEDYDIEPAVSPDGKWVAFLRVHAEQVDERFGICVAPTDGGEVVELNLHGLRVAQVGPRPTWSPDSRELAFPAVDDDDNIDIYRLSREGGSPVQVTVGQGTDFQPSWSPDGKYIAFTRIHGGQSQLWVIPATGGLAQQISSGGTYNAYSVWDKRSERVAYLSVDTDQSYNTWVASVDNPEDRLKVASSNSVVIPVGWVASGEELVIWRQMEDTVHLCSIRPDGTGERVVADQRKDMNSGLAFTFVPNSERYHQAFYEGIPYGFAHVERAGDVYVARVSQALIRSQALAEGTR